MIAGIARDMASIGYFLAEVLRLTTDFVLGKWLEGTTEGLDGWTQYYLMQLQTFGMGGDRLAVQGWAVESADRLSTVADALRAAGARRFIYTNVLRDGTLRGVDLAELQRLMPLGLPVIVAGGIASADDVRAVRDAGAEGVIIGRALVDGSLDLGDAMRAAAGQPVGPPAT